MVGFLVGVTGLKLGFVVLGSVFEGGARSLKIGVGAGSLGFW